LKRHLLTVAMLFALSLGLHPRLATAQDRRLPVRLRTVILFKALTYDRNLTRTRGKLNVGVVCAERSATSRRLGREVAVELARIQHKKVKGLQIKHSLLIVKDAKQLQDLVKRRGVNVLYLSSDIDHLLARVRAVALRHKMLVLSGEAHHIRKGAAVTVVQRGTKPKILINLTSARVQGASFDARLLNLSDVIF
jgi:hypothetical protein